MTKKNPLALLVTIALVVPATAFAGVFYNNPDGINDHPRDAMAKAWLVRVKPGAKARFYWNVVTPNCPALTSACRRPGHLIPGDVAVASYTTGAFTIVEFVGPQGHITDGAVESRLLERVEPPAPSPKDWIGYWKSDDQQTISVTATSTRNVLAFLGDATWGADDPNRVKMGSVHTGALAAYVKPIGEWGGFTEDNADFSETEEGTLQFPPITTQKDLDTDWTKYFPAEFDDPDVGCRASFRLLGPYLLAYTPVDRCGGGNVTFTGVYRRVQVRHK